jgi:hypothetical protein
MAGTHIEANYIQKSEDKMSSSRLTDEDRYKTVSRLFRSYTCASFLQIVLSIHFVLMQINFIHTV